MSYFDKENKPLSLSDFDKENKSLSLFQRFQTLTRKISHLYFLKDLGL